MRTTVNTNRPMLFLALMTLAAVLTGCGQGVSTIASGGTTSSSGTSSTGSQGDTSSGGNTSGSATVSWLAPTENTNGSAVTDLAGYRVYYGTNADELTQTVEVSGPDVTSYVLSGLSPGTYYFAVAAVSNEGQESSLSEIASKTI